MISDLTYPQSISRIVIPIGISIKEVNAVFGCKDELLFENILLSDDYKKYEEEFSFKKELYDIMFNYIPPGNRTVKTPKLFGLVKGTDGRGLKGEWNDYGYALLTICCYLGKKFSENNTEYIYHDHWEKINTYLRNKGSGIDLSRMHETKQIFDTPFEHQDIYTNFYSNTEVVKFIETLCTDQHTDHTLHSELHTSLKKGLLHCKETNRDLIVFSFE